MAASHGGDYGEYGDIGKFLSNRQTYANYLNTWWPAMVVSIWCENTCILGYLSTDIICYEN